MSDNATELEFGETVAPLFDTPVTDEIIRGVVPFDERYPDSTPEAPFGYKANGDPYTRHHGGRGKTGGSKQSSGMPATDRQARMASKLLARLNALIAMSINMAGMPMTAQELAENNDAFEEAAFEALLADPVMCRKILSAGATSGKAGLVMAYVILGGSVVPTMRVELRDAKARRELMEREDES